MEFSFSFSRPRALRAFLSKISPSAIDQSIDPASTSAHSGPAVEPRQLPPIAVPLQNEPQQSPTSNVLQETPPQELPAIATWQEQEPTPPPRMPERELSSAATTAPVYVVISDSDDNASDGENDKADVIAISSDDNAPEDDARSDTRSTPSVRAVSVEYRPPDDPSIPEPGAPQEDPIVSTSEANMDLDPVVVVAERPPSEAADDDMKSVSSEEGSFDDEYEYGDDALMDGEQEINLNQPLQARLDVNFVDLMNKSYHSSRDELLTYQQRMLEKATRRRQLTSSYKVPKTIQPAGVTKEELETIIKQVTAYTRTLKPVNWIAVAIEVFCFTGFRRSADDCREAFERTIAQYSTKARRPQYDWMNMHSKTSMMSLLGRRELGTQNRHLIQDMLRLRKLKDYVCATTFNYSSGSVVDMALKTSTMKLAVANVATQDMYNRPGNLLLCDLKNGQTMQLQGHDHPDNTLNQHMTETVNDIKLTFSKDFFISGADDHKTKIWNAETGQCVHTIGNNESRVNRLAVMEASLHGDDIFATCSAEGTINIYQLDAAGQVCKENKKLVAPGGRRGISSISFGYGHFWDCLAAGLEGTDIGGGESLHGQVAFYDASNMERVAVSDLGFKYVGSGQTSRSVSCLSFSSTGRLLACGTSGRTCAVEEERGDGRLRIFDVAHAKNVLNINSGHEDANLVEFSPCEQYVISGSHNNDIAVFDIRAIGAEPLHRFSHPSSMDDDNNAGITSALWWPRSFGTNQPVLISGGGDGAIKLWDIRRATEDAQIWSMEANLGPIARMTASESFEHLVVGGDTGAVSVFTLDHDLVSKYQEKPMALLSDEEESQ
ncbi:hypothetical protein KVV02_006823 [Mortierella alpina]|uniref:WD40 repeat-like protein n=1 Tax=Mortierella alpina TaxID=64518 RepID=A0A9P8A1C2_MORAP|nr:hypothetical protein KVV02_006823 [Mortierella alpina]